MKGKINTTVSWTSWHVKYRGIPVKIVEFVTLGRMEIRWLIKTNSYWSTWLISACFDFRLIIMVNFQFGWSVFINLWLRCKERNYSSTVFWNPRFRYEIIGGRTRLLIMGARTSAKVKRIQFDNLDTEKHAKSGFHKILNNLLDFSSIRGGGEVIVKVQFHGQWHDRSFEYKANNHFADHVTTVCKPSYETFNMNSKLSRWNRYVIYPF